ncbi:PQQ-binding-like beta-propeller repeat protein [Promicromonospora sp. NPDC019610]|uniref:outer membrane protein assembly factor BamB family protein n=1 Tax=Promicromonospora sp. NPDC019610 TaxID=3364405 RepID=UPI0037BD678F
MAREPDEGAAYVFDLVDDDAAEPGVLRGAARAGGTDGQEPADGRPGADGTDPGGAGAWAGGPAPSGGQVVTWRRAAPVLALLAVALGTGLAVDGARDAARMERMRDVPGGVADLSAPLDETWSWQGKVDLGEGMTDVAVLGGDLVFESEGELVALDPATGEESWTVDLGGGPECGPTVSPVWDDPRTPALVCLQGRGRETEVVVVRPGGATSAPRLLPAADAARYGQPHTGPDGTVLRARRVGPVLPLGEDVRCDESGDCDGQIVDGRDLVLRAEDAVTGEERWSVTVPFRSTEAAQCTSTFSAAWGSSENRIHLRGQFATEAFGARVRADLVNVEGCGVQAAVTSSGVLLGSRLEPGSSVVGRLDSGGYLGMTWDDVTRTLLYDADGATTGEVRGYVITPKSTDEAGPATLLAIDETGRRLSAHEADGTARWDIALQSGGQEFLAQVGETAVITTGAGTVRGLDLATGEERWTWDGSDPDVTAEGGYFGTAYVVQSFTDGEVVLLLAEGNGSVARGMVALDAGTGEVVWDEAGGGPGTTLDPHDGDVVRQGVTGDLVAVDGHLMEVGSVGVRGLG